MQNNCPLLSICSAHGVFFLSASQVMLVVKNPPTSAGDIADVGSVPGREDPLKEVPATTHSSILAGRTPWTEEPGGLQSIGLQRVGDDWSDLA